MNREDRQRKLIRAILAVYILLIIRLVIFKYPWAELRQIAQSWERSVVLEGLDTANFTPCKTIRMYIRYYGRLNSFENLFGNVLIFIPFGYLLPKASDRLHSLLAVFSVTLLFVTGIEVFQLFSAFGAFDVDDFILNCLGAILGYGIMKIGKKLQKVKNKD